MDFTCSRMLYILVFLFGLFIKSGEGACTFPSDLVGTWFTSAEKDSEIVFTADNVTSFDFTITATFNDVIMECFLSDGTYYVTKSTTTATALGQPYRFYRCWSFEQKSSDKYIYRDHAYVNTDAGGTRTKLVQDSVTVTSVNEICEDTNLAGGEYSVLIKNGTAA